MRRPWLISLAVGIALLIAVLGPTIVALTITSSGHAVNAPAGKLTARATQPLLSAALVLSTKTVKAGGEIPGQIVVENRTGNDINQIGCHGIFQVLLASSTYTPDPGWLLCWQRITIPAGQSSFPVRVRAAYGACGQLGPIGAIPACPRGSSLAPLPPGDYWATTFEIGNTIPLPAPIKVRVT